MRSSLILWLCLWVAAETPTLIKDLNATTGSIDPTVIRFLCAYNGSYYFTGRAHNAPLLFRTDGSDAGTQGVASLNAQEAIVYNGKLVVATSDALWQSNGTTAGTTLLYSEPGMSSISPFAIAAGKLFFVATSSVGRELWVSDGTTDGTKLVKNIRPSGDDEIGNLTSFAGKLFFSARDDTYGRELWMSDGTAAGTVMVKDIYVGSPSSEASSFCVIGSWLYFSARDVAHGRELWRSDGTTGGTQLLKDINPGTADSHASHLVALGTKLLFAALNSANGYELWSSDGTAAGTQLLKDLNPGAASGFINNSFIVGNLCFFNGDNGSSGEELCVSDGTSTGTQLVKDIEPGSAGSSPNVFRDLNGQLLFAANTTAQGFEMWKSDGTSAGTQLVIDLVSGSAPGCGGISSPLGNTAFVAEFATGNLWSTDGTAAITQRVTQRIGSLGSNPSDYSNSGPNLFFSIEGSTPYNRKLATSNGTAAGTQTLNVTGLVNPAEITPNGSDVYFSAGVFVSPSSQYELWKSNGTVAGTSLVRSHVGSLGPNLHNLTAFNGDLYFGAVDEPGLAGISLWKSDGTGAGTQVLSQFASPEYLTTFNGKLIYYRSLLEEIWESDGTVGGTQSVTWAQVDGDFFEFNGKLFFSGSPYSSGFDYELCYFNGTSVGYVKDIVSGSSGSHPFGMVSSGSQFHFFAQDSNGDIDIWKSDGTTANTTKVADLPGQVRSGLIVIKDELFFLMQTPALGIELWRCDGTTAGLQLVVDLGPGPLSGPDALWKSNNRMYLQVWQAASGRELWTSDGTASGTHIVTDLMPGPDGYVALKDSYVLGRTMYFSGASSPKNSELWSIPILPNAAIHTLDHLCPNQAAVTACVVQADAGASYQWTATNATITAGQGTPQITFNAGASGTVQLDVTVTDSGGSSQKSLQLAIRPNLSSAGTITGSQSPCIGATATYSVPASNDVDTFTWQVPLGWTIQAGQGTASIQVTVGANPGTLSVLAQNPCSTSPASNLAVTPASQPPLTPTSISGPASVCSFQSGVVFTTPAIAAASGYAWTVPADATIIQGQGSTSITVNFGDLSGFITVSAQNGCGSSGIYSQTLTVVPPPSAANAGPDQNLAYGQTANLNGNQPISGVGIWSVVSGPDTSLSQFADVSSPTTAFTPAISSGVYTLAWTITKAPCSASSDTLILTFAPPQNVDLEINLSCANSTPSVGEETFVGVSLQNSSGQSATGIAIQVMLDSAIQGQSFSPSDGVFDSNTMIWTLPSLGPGSFVELTIAAYPLWVAPLEIGAEVIQCNQADADSSPNNHNPLEDDQDSCNWQVQDYLYFPDPNLKAVLTQDPNVDSYDDDEISPYEAQFVTVLDCTAQAVSDLTGLDQLYNLTEISASGNPIQTLPSIQNLTLLFAFFLEEGLLTDFNDPFGVYALPPNLSFVSVARNHIDSVPFEIFLTPNLQFLDLSFNPIGQPADAFDLVPNLWFLGLESCGMPAVPSTVSALPNLQSLFLGRNQIALVPPLPASLMQLGLASNKVRAIDELAFCPLLEYVDLNHNMIDDLSPLASVSGLLTSAHHYLTVQYNLLDPGDCPTLSDLQQRAGASGAFLAYDPQGNFSMFHPELPQWYVVPGRLQKWVNDVTLENFAQPLSCP